MDEQVGSAVRMLPAELVQRVFARWNEQGIWEKMRIPLMILI